MRGWSRWPRSASPTRNCLEVGGVWIDEGFNAKTQTVVVKAMSDAYFRILELHPEVKEVFRLGNHLVWITPSGTALVIDTATARKGFPTKRSRSCSCQLGSNRCSQRMHEGPRALARGFSVWVGQGNVNLND